MSQRAAMVRCGGLLYRGRDAVGSEGRGLTHSAGRQVHKALPLSKLCSLLPPPTWQVLESVNMGETLDDEGDFLADLHGSSSSNKSSSQSQGGPGFDAWQKGR